MPDGVSFNAGTKLTSSVTLSDGTTLPAGTWVVDQGDIAGLQIRQDTNVSDDFDVRIYSQTTEGANNDQAVTGPETIHVDVGIVDPSVSGTGSGNEDTWITLDLDANVNAADGSESLSVYIEDLPTDVEIRYINSGNALTKVNGRYEVTGNLDNIEVRWDPSSDLHSDQDIAFNLRAVVTDVDAGTASDNPITDTVAPDTSDNVSAVSVTVKAVADQAAITADSVGVEDQWFDLDVGVSLTDTDGSESITSILIEGVPDGAQLNKGTQILDGSGQPTGTWSFQQSELSGLQVKLAQDSNDDFQLTIKVTTEEAASGDQVAVKTVTATKTLDVQVFGDADMPTVDVVSATQTVLEDTMFNLRSQIAGNFAVDGDLTEANSADQTTSDDGSESLTFRITPQEAGTRLAISDDASISSDEFIDLPAEGYWTVSAADIFAGKVYVGGASDWSSDNGADSIHFDIQTISTEDDATRDDSALNGTGLSRDGAAMSAAKTLTLEITPDADAPTISVTNARGPEDTAIALDIRPVLTDSDGSESLNVLITDVPEGAVFKDSSGNSVGERVNIAPDGSLVPDANGTHWSFDNNEWQDLTITPPLHSDVDFTLDLTIRSTESANGDYAEINTTLDVVVDAVTDAPTLAANDVAGMENTWIDMDITTALVDADGSESLSVYIADVPDGVSFNAGTKLTSSVTLADGTTLPAGTWVVDQGDIAGLQVRQDTNVSDDFDVRVFSQTTESDNSDQAVTGPETVHVDVGIVDPSVSGSGSGSEDAWITLDLDANINAADGTENLAVYIENLPSGVDIRYADNPNAVPLVNGRYEVTGNLDNIQIRWDQSTDKHSEADISFQLRAVATDVDAGTASDNPITDPVAPDTSDIVSTVDVVVKAVADKASITASGVGVEDQWFDLDVDVSLTDTDGSETITSIVLEGIPTDAQLNHGTAILDGSGQPTGAYSFTENELSGLQIKMGEDSNDNFQLTVKVTTEESSTGDQVAVKTVTASKTVEVQVFGDADMPTVDVVSETQFITEDTMYNLRTSLAGGFAVDGDLTEANSADQTTSDDGSETLTFRISPQENGTRLAISDDATISSDEYVDLPAEGYWTVSAADLFAGKIYVGGAENWSSSAGGDAIHFDITAVSTENDANLDDSALDGSGLSRDGTAVSSAETLTLEINPSVDGVRFTAAATGNEDQAGGIEYAPVIRLVDTDGSESFTGNVVITSSDADMIAGHLELGGSTLTPSDNGDGSYSWSIPISNLTATGTAGEYQLDNVVFFPEQHNADDIDLTLTVTTVESRTGETNTVTGNGTITIKSIADAPVIDVGAADVNGVVTGTEDTYIELGLDAQLVDTDGSESLKNYRLYDVPDDWEVGYLDDQGAYSTASKGSSYWTLNEDRLDEVVLKPPAETHDTAGIDLRYRVYSQELEANNQVKTRWAYTTENFTVKVNADADVPSVITKNAVGDEDTDIALDIRPALGSDRDGSESLSVLMGDIPEGSVFYDGSGNPIGERVNVAPDGSISADANGSYWYFTNNEWDDLHVRPPEDSNEDFTIDLRVRSTEASNGDFEEITSAIEVNVIGVADAPQVPSGTVVINGDEDTVIDPNFIQYASKDNTDGSETLSIVISDIPSGVNVAMTSGNEDYLKYIGNGKWSVEADHIGDVRVTTSNNFAGTKEMTVKFISTENDGDVNAVTRTVQFAIEAEADQPTASISASVIEDTQSISLNINAAPSDRTTESPETITEIRINVDDSGLPGGTNLQLTYDGQTYSLGAGDDLVIAVDANTAGYDAQSGTLSGVVLEGVPADWSTNIPVSMTVTSTDIDGSTAQRTVNGSVKIIADADPLSTFSANANVSGDAGDTLALGVNVAFADTDGSESAYYVVSGVPDGVNLSDGFSVGDGTWFVPSSVDVSTLSITSPYSGSATIQMRAVVVDNDPDGGLDRHTMDPIDINIAFDGSNGGGGDWDSDPWGAPVAPDVSSSITGNEDVSFNLSGMTMTVNQAGGTPSAIIITDLPNGASISGAYLNPIDGSWVVPYDDRGDVTIKPPADYAGEIQMDVTVVSIDTNGVTSSVTMNDFVVADLSPVTDGGSFSGGAAAGANLMEDGGLIPLDLTLSQLDDDLSEGMTVDQVKISNLPTGAKLYQNGVELTANGDGDFVISTGSIDGNSSVDITGLSLEAPANFDGTISLQLETEFQDQTGAAKTVTGSISVGIEGVADTAQLSAANVSGAEDSVIDLDLQAFNPDVIGTYASERMTVMVTGVPDGAVVSGASNNGDGTWTIKNANIDTTTGDISNVTILPPRNFSGTMNLQLKTFSIEKSNDDIAETTQSFSVSVSGVADTPDIDPVASFGSEDLEVALSINAALSDADETMIVTISDVPDGAHFTDGAGNTIGVEVQIDGNGKPVLDGNNQPVPVSGGAHTGAWYFTAAQITVVHFVGPANATGSYDMKAVATTIDGDSVANSLVESFNVSLTGVPDVVNLVINDLSDALDAYQAVGSEDQSGGIALDIDASLTDTDGSETLQLVITNAPAGSVFVSGATTISADVNGQWIIDQTQISDLKIVPPENYNGSFHLQIEAQSLENGQTNSTMATLDVNVEAVNDAAVISIPVADQAVSGLVVDPLTVVPDATDAGLQINISDVDGTHLTGMDFQITNGASLGDTLGLHGVDISMNANGAIVVNGTDITVTYDQSTSTLSFQGTADHATYADLAEKVVLTNSTGEFSAGMREIEITSYDESGKTGSIDTTTNIDGGGATLSDTAMADVMWGANGVTLSGGEGDEQFIINLGDVQSVQGGLGDDVLFLRGSAGGDGDWLFNIESDGSATMTSASDPNLSGMVSLDHGNIDSNNSSSTELVFDGDASGQIELDNGEVIEFSDLDQIVV